MTLQLVQKELKSLDCYPVFLGKHLKERYYKGERDDASVLLMIKALPWTVRTSFTVWYFAGSRRFCVLCAGFCKQQLWPLFHYLLPLSPLSSSRFDPDLWQSYVKANKVRIQPTVRYDHLHCNSRSSRRASGRCAVVRCSRSMRSPPRVKDKRNTLLSL